MIPPPTTRKGDREAMVIRSGQKLTHVRDGSLSMGRVTSSDKDDYFSIDLYIGGERTRVELSLENFALAVTGRGYVPVIVRQTETKEPQS